MEGIILKGIGGFYTVVDGGGAEHTLRAQAKLRRQRLTPMVGDRVAFTPGDGEAHGWVTEILKRTSSLTRPPVANIDIVVLTVAATAPKADLLLIDRLLISSFQSGIAPVLAINKADEDAREAESIARQYRGAGIGAFIVSAQDQTGVNALRDALKGTIHAFGGQSGVGKSTLINALYGLDLTTGALSDKIDRGKHTTRHAELISVPGGGMVLDTPGFSLLDPPLVDPIELKGLYPEFQPYEGQCRFTPCAHDKEPDCAVKQAVEAGTIDRARHERYIQLFQEMRERWKDRYD